MLQDYWKYMYIVTSLMFLSQACRYLNLCSKNLEPANATNRFCIVACFTGRWWFAVSEFYCSQWATLLSENNGAVIAKTMRDRVHQIWHFVRFWSLLKSGYMVDSCASCAIRASNPDEWLMSARSTTAADGVNTIIQTISSWFCVLLLVFQPRSKSRLYQLQHCNGMEFFSFKLILRTKCAQNPTNLQNVLVETLGSPKLTWMTERCWLTKTCTFSFWQQSKD